MLKIYPVKKKLRQTPEQKMEQERLKYLELIGKFLENQLTFEESPVKELLRFGKTN